MKLPDVEPILREAQATVEGARMTREEHRRRTRPDRLEELTAAIVSINRVMKPVRSLVQAAGWRGPGKVPYEFELRQVSEDLQRERRKLRKMLNATPPGVVALDADPLEGAWS
jgi:hypothetical protein